MRIGGWRARWWPDYEAVKTPREMAEGWDATLEYELRKLFAH